MREYDVVVLGAGAAGLVAAARAAECGARVLLVEKNRRPGVKILMSGGTRCNITNARGLRRLDVVSGPVNPAYDIANCRGIRAIQQAFGDNGAFLAHALRRFDVDATIRMFEESGVATKVEANGKIFPVSDKAAQVLDALIQRLERSRAQLRCADAVLGIDRLEPGPRFEVKLSTETVTARRVIIAVGGCFVPGVRHDRRRLLACAAVRPSDRRAQASARSALRECRVGHCSARAERPRCARFSPCWSQDPSVAPRGGAFHAPRALRPGDSRREPSGRAVPRTRQIGAPTRSAPRHLT